MKKERMHGIEKKELLGVVVIILVLSIVMYKVISISFSSPISIQKCNALADDANSGNMTAGIAWVSDMCPCLNHSHIIPNAFDSANFTDTQACSLQN